MTAVTSRAESVRVEGDLGLDDLRGGSLRWLVVVCWAAAGVLVAYLPAFSAKPMVENWSAATALLLLGAIVWRLTVLQFKAAAYLLSGGLLVIGCAGLLLYPGSLAACVLSTVVVAVSIAVGPAGTLAVAALATAVVLVASSLEAPLVSGDVALVAVLLICSNATLAFLGSRPLHTALHWAWGSLVKAQEIIEQLRDSRGQLGRVTKSLQEAYTRLEQLNVELDRARRVAEEARRLKAEFASAISHELRTPLNLIIGFSEMMIASPESSYGEKLPESYRDDVEAIYRSAAHLSHLVDDILDLSQIDAHRMGLHKEGVLLPKVVDQALGAIGSLFRDKGLYLRADLPPDLPPLHADPTRVRQVLLNLLGNAARFTDEGGVTITAERRDREVVVTVRDTGVGIAPEDLPLVFQEFRQLCGASRGGSGLGLAVSKRLIELHGGAMWVESAPGEGSSFSFSLPVGEMVVASPFDSRPQLWEQVRDADGNGQVVAVVDGSREREAARILEHYLDRFEVVGVRSLREARRVADRAKLRALLLTSSASPATSLLRAQSEFPDLPIVTCSMSGVDTPIQELGAQAYLVKPVAREQLLAALRRLGTHVHQVLIVDDEPEMVRLLAQMVRTSRRYCVWEAQGGAEGLRLLREVRPDAVILDLLMPEVDGYAVLAEMRRDEGLRDTPVVVVTARGYEERAVKVQSLGFSRAGGLTIGEASRCLSATLETLLSG